MRTMEKTVVSVVISSYNVFIMDAKVIIYFSDLKFEKFSITVFYN